VVWKTTVEQKVGELVGVPVGVKLAVGLPEVGEGVALGVEVTVGGTGVGVSLAGVEGLFEEQLMITKDQKAKRLKNRTFFIKKAPLLVAISQMDSGRPIY
jgi:hypothetical protein